MGMLQLEETIFFIVWFQIPKFKF